MKKKSEGLGAKVLMIIISALFLWAVIAAAFRKPVDLLIIPGVAGLIIFFPEIVFFFFGERRKQEKELWESDSVFASQLLKNRLLLRFLVLLVITGVCCLIAGLFKKGYSILLLGVAITGVFLPLAIKVRRKADTIRTEREEIINRERSEKEEVEYKQAMWSRVIEEIGNERIRRIEETISELVSLISGYTNRTIFKTKFNRLITIEGLYFDYEDKICLIAIRDLLNAMEREESVNPDFPSVKSFILQLSAYYLTIPSLHPAGEINEPDDFMDQIKQSREFGETYLSKYYRVFQEAQTEGKGDEQDYLLGKYLGFVNKDAESKYVALIDFLVREAFDKNDSGVDDLSGIGQLDELIGLAPVKREIRTLANVVKINEFRKNLGLKVSQMSYHCVFTGNPGTGKTTVARLVGQIYKELGVLKRGHLVETDRSGLVAEYVGQTAAKTNRIIDSALDGVLFIDEAYTLVSSDEKDFGSEAIATLLKRMEDNRDRLVVILAGYTDEIRHFINSNPGLQSRFTRYIDFPDYSGDELHEIFLANLNKHEYYLAENADDALMDVLRSALEHRDKRFGNARYVRNLFEKTLEKQANRLSGLMTVTKEELMVILPEDIEKAAEDNSGKDNRDRPAIERLDGLIGLAPVKKEIKTLANVIQINKLRKEQGLKVPKMSYHCVFTGNPGTGKTTVARLVSQIYKELGVLKRGHLVETDRSGLVAEYVGQTAVKTNEIIDSALGGVLFIDEAYTLINSAENDFGHEAVATLLKRMEDDRDRLVVILAGYTEEMRLFIDSNPGLQSRFTRYVEFPDYSEEELYEIFIVNLNKYEYHLADHAEETLMAILKAAVESRDRNFGNGRFARNLFEKTVENQSNRLSGLGSVSKDELMAILPEDIAKAVDKRVKEEADSQDNQQTKGAETDDPC